jgi:uncharacterized membrane protein
MWLGKENLIMSKKKVLTKKERIREMTILGLFIAIIVVMGMVPFLGFIPIFGLSATIVHIPVLIGAVLLGRKNGIILGLAFGVVSLIRGATSVGFDFVFIFPWVSVLPRLIFGLIIYDVYRLFNKVIRVRIVALIVSFIVLSLIHSLLVLPMLVTTFPLVLGSAAWSETVGASEGVLGFMQDTSSFGTAMRWIWGVLITNSLAEAALAGVIGGTVADRLIQYLKLNNTALRVEA